MEESDGDGMSAASAAEAAAGAGSRDGAGAMQRELPGAPAALRKSESLITDVVEIRTFLPSTFPPRSKVQRGRRLMTDDHDGVWAQEVQLRRSRCALRACA
jgi:hypothetical protein